MSTTVAASLANSSAIDVNTFADITPNPVESVSFESGFVVVTFAGNPLPASVIQAVIRRISLPPAAESALADLEQRVTALESPK